MEDEKSESDIDMTEDNKSENQQITMGNTKIISKNGLCLVIRRFNTDSQTGRTVLRYKLQLQLKGESNSFFQKIKILINFKILKKTKKTSQIYAQKPLLEDL